MKPQTGILLRLLGFLVEISCAAILMKTRGAESKVAGMPLETLLYVGFAIGLMMVIAGLTLVPKKSRKGRPSIPDLDLGAGRDPNPY